MSVWKEPITDRSLYDVEYAKRTKSNSVEPLKGARNVEDFRRITGNMQYLSGRIKNLLSIDVVINSKSEWDDNEFPGKLEIEQIRTDLNALARSVEMEKIAPELPWTTYQKMNEVEQMILNVYTYLSALDSGVLFAGTFYPGDDYIYQLLGGINE